MAWKILLGISSACLLASAIFAFLNSKDLKWEKTLALRAEANLKDQRKLHETATEKQAEKVALLAAVKKELEESKQKVATAAAESQEKDAKLQLAKSNLDQISKQVAELQKKIDEAGSVKDLIAKVEALKKDHDAADAELASQVQQLAAMQGTVAGLQKEVISYRDAEARARKGVVEPGFNANVATVFQDWGFVILNKGNASGVFANADLEVKRGKDVVAKLKVRNVEQKISIADVIPGSLTSGSLRSGDLVVAAATQAAAAPAPSQPAQAPVGGGAAAPVVPAVPAAGAAMGNDPFATGGAMPAGAAPAAPAPAAGMASDPFGAAPAPAPAAEAVPAGGAGTKASPSTADPFGGAPAAAPGAAPAAPAAPAPGAAPAAPGAAPAPAAGATPPPAGGAVDPFAPAK